MRTELEAIQRDLPQGLEASVAYDTSEYISNAIREVVGTLTDTLTIVVIVIFLFLGAFRSVLVPVVAIPVSLIGGIFLMQTFGFTLNLLTLLAIVLSVGLVLVGGMTVGTLFTLFVVPSLYMLIARQHDAERIAAPPVNLSMPDALERL